MSSAYVLDETAQARRELRASQLSGQHLNAEDLIRSHFASVSPEVRSGIRLNENADALAAARDAEADKQIQPPDGGTVISWTVRGTDQRRMVLSYVWEDEEGRWHHGVQGYNDNYQGPVESDADRATREVAMADHAVRLAGVEGNLNLAEKMEEFRREQEVKIGEAFAALKDDLVSTIGQLVADRQEKKAATAEAEGEGEPFPTTTQASGHGDPSLAPPPGGDEGGNGGSEYPKQHAPLDALLEQSGQEKPDGWDDMKVDDKVAYLKGHNVEPEAAEG